MTPKEPREKEESAERAELEGTRSEPGGDIDWSLTTFEGLRRKQRLEFAALSFDEKLDRLEQMGEIVEMFDAIRKDRVDSGGSIGPDTSPKPGS